MDVENREKKMSNNSNDKIQAGYDLYNEIILSWGHAFDDEQTGEGVYHPTSYAGVQKAFENLEKIDELGIDDEELKSLTDNIRSIAENATKRKFAGSKLIIFLCGIAVLFLVWNWMDGFFQKATGYHSYENADELYAKELEKIQKNIKYYSSSPKASGERRFSGSQSVRESSYELYQQRLTDIKDLSPKDYIERENARIRSDAMQNLFATIFWLGLYIAYFFTSRAPVYIINRRRKELHFMKQSSSFFARFLYKWASITMAAPLSVSVVKDINTGQVLSKKTHYEDYFFRIGMICIVAFTIIISTIVLLPILVVVSYIRNYQFEKIEKFATLIKGALGIKPKQKEEIRKVSTPEENIPERVIPALENAEPGSCFFAKYSGDGFFYYARIDESRENKYLVTFYDDYQEEVLSNEICDIPFALQYLTPQANRENQGNFYPCLAYRKIDQFFARYEDGVVEEINIEQLRFS
jgi:hypothetical protein